MKDGDRYYHQECVKGPCSKCGKNVFAEQGREETAQGRRVSTLHVQLEALRPSNTKTVLPVPAMNGAASRSGSA